MYVQYMVFDSIIDGFDFIGKEDDILNKYFINWNESAEKKIPDAFNMVADEIDMTKK